MPRKPFEQGNKLAPGGARPGAGRKTNAFKAKARRILDRAKGLEYLGRVLSGKEFVMKQVKLTDKSGDDKWVDAKEFPDHTERIMAFRELRDTGHGKPRQEVELTDANDLLIGLAAIVQESRAARGLDYL